MSEDNPKPKKRSVILIREMEIDDLPAVFHMGESLFTAEAVPNLYRTWDEHEIVQMFDTDPEFCLVAEYEEKIVGFLLGTTVEKARSAWKYGLLIWLGISPDFQQKGVGAKLFRHFRELMKKEGVRMLVVDTEADNEAALQFFNKLGFCKPQEHVYLTLNMAGKKRPAKKPKETRGPNQHHEQHLDPH